jgi:acyl-coenzyme A thioesterase PaaI-like protein
LSRADIEKQRRSVERLANATPAPSGALQRIGDAVRRLGCFATTARDDPDALEPIARGLEALLGRLPDGPGADGAVAASRYQEAMDRMNPLPNPRGTHPLLGCISPVAPPLHLRLEGERAVADVEFDVRFEGNEGWVHGGYVAAGFDIMAVTAARFSGQSGPTGSLQVRYVAPTPVREPLRYEAWLEQVDGRKLRVRGELRRVADGELTAELEGVVIGLRPES